MDKVYWFIILKSCKYSLLSSDSCGIGSDHREGMKRLTHIVGGVISRTMKPVLKLKQFAGNNLSHPVPFTSCSCQSDPHHKSPPSL